MAVGTNLVFLPKIAASPGLRVGGHAGDGDIKVILAQLGEPAGVRLGRDGILGIPILELDF
jgi:hypothetical protein